MLPFIVKRVVSGVLLTVGVTLVVYCMIFSNGMKIADRVLGGQTTEAQVAAEAHALGLDQPVLLQYGKWLVSALHGDLGSSWFTSQPVLPTVFQRLSVTLSIVVVALLVVTILSVLMGVGAAVRRGWVDRVLQVVGVAGIALPSVWVALVLVLFFSLTLKVLPATGFTALTTDPGQWAASIVLPVIALAVGGIAATAQQVRSAVIAVLEQDYIRTLRSRGLSARRVLWTHVLRNASPPGLTILSLQFIGMVGGAVVIERVFAINGMGTLTVDSTVQSDIPVVMGVMAVMTVVVVLVNLAIDVVNGILNPKARLS
jgi:peptide/nickel transport system permease protein